MSSEKMVVSGDVTMETVPAMFAQGLQQLSSNDLVVDLSQTHAVDSAAVSMLLAWQRAAQSGQRALQIENMPEDLLSLAKLYGVEEMLPKQFA
ncbi:MAG: STAS domain-containing protein [Gallionella sp.]|nr:STAS domain-containing protein [Gallionella sp.]